jgi:S-adenosylmethionine-diacylglycerol 3-amino-3-carboxypropyl transferase
VKTEWAAGQLGKSSRKEPEIVFGRVHEDVQCEMMAAAAAPDWKRAFTIGSGGCAAFSLLALGFERVDAVDINPAQLHLINLKRAILARGPRERCIHAFTADAREAVKECLADLDRDCRLFWERRLNRCERGLLFSGVAEGALQWLVRLFHVFVCSRRRMARLLNLSDRAQQEIEWERSIATWRWKLALGMIFNSRLLRLAYGSSILSRLPSKPGEAIDQQFHDAATLTPARFNQSLWLMFAGKFPPASEAGLPQYLRASDYEKTREVLSRLVTTCREAAEFLLSQQEGSFDALMLSNILDLTSAQDGRALSSAIIHAAKPNAVIVTRAIFPNVAPSLEARRLREDHELSRKLRERDCSLICRNVTVFRRE